MGENNGENYGQSYFWSIRDPSQGASRLGSGKSCPPSAIDCPATQYKKTENQMNLSMNKFFLLDLTNHLILLPYEFLSKTR